MGMHVRWEEIPGFTADDDWRIEDAEAMARLAAPCLASIIADGDQAATVKAILRGALMRWKDQGTGVKTSVTKQAGAFQLSETTDNRSWIQTKGGIFTADELDDLRKLCSPAANATSGTAATITPRLLPHPPWCSIHFSAGQWPCSCGVSLTGRPIYEPEP